VGARGIQLSSAKSLTIENCVVRNVHGLAIELRPNGASTIAISNTFVADNTSRGISLDPTGAGTVRAVFTRVEVHNVLGNGIAVSGLNSTGTVIATVTDSVVSNSGSTAFAVLSSAGHSAAGLMLVRSTAVNSATGLASNGPFSTLRLARSTVSGNGVAWSAGGGGILQSYGDNYIDGNLINDGGQPLVIATR